MGRSSSTASGDGRVGPADDRVWPTRADPRGSRVWTALGHGRCSRRRWFWPCTADPGSSGVRWGRGCGRRFRTTPRGSARGRFRGCPTSRGFWTGSTGSDDRVWRRLCGSGSPSSSDRLWTAASRRSARSAGGGSRRVWGSARSRTSRGAWRRIWARFGSTSHQLHASSGCSSTSRCGGGPRGNDRKDTECGRDRAVQSTWRL